MSLARQVKRKRELELRKHLKKCHACMNFFGHKEGAPCSFGVPLANAAAMVHT